RGRRGQRLEPDAATARAGVASRQSQRSAAGVHGLAAATGIVGTDGTDRVVNLRQRRGECVKTAGLARSPGSTTRVSQRALEGLCRIAAVRVRRPESNGNVHSSDLRFKSEVRIRSSN